MSPCFVRSARKHLAASSVAPLPTTPGPPPATLMQQLGGRLITAVRPFRTTLSKRSGTLCAGSSVLTCHAKVFAGLARTWLILAPRAWPSAGAFGAGPPERRCSPGQNKPFDMARSCAGWCPLLLGLLPPSWIPGRRRVLRTAAFDMFWSMAHFSQFQIEWLEADQGGGMMAGCTFSIVMLVLVIGGRAIIGRWHPEFGSRAKAVTLDCCG